MAKKIASVALVLVAIVLVIVAFAGVTSNQSTRTNRVIDKIDLQRTDRYMADEVIKTWYGQVGLTNVEEYGTNDGKVSAIIHYKNTSTANVTLAPSDLGIFMDESFDYALKGIKDEKKKYEPGDSAEFRVYIERVDGLDGLSYLISEPKAKESGITTDTQVVYQASVDLNMLNPDTKEKTELYGISDTYTEEVNEDSIGRDADHVTMMGTVEELILKTEVDAEVAKDEEERVIELEQSRKEALDLLNSQN